MNKREYKREYNKRYYWQNRDDILPKMRKYNQDHKEALNTYHRQWRKNRYATDTTYHTIKKLRDRLREAVRVHGKTARTMDLTGCTGEQLIHYLECQLPPGAELRDFHIDHVRPIASFDFSNPLHQRVCFHWSNLAPLTPAENLAKRDRRDPLRWGGVHLADAQEMALRTGDLTELNNPYRLLALKYVHDALRGSTSAST